MNPALRFFATAFTATAATVTIVALMPVPAYAQGGLPSVKASNVAGAEYPNRPMRFIVPSAAGGGPDVNSRLLVAELSKQMGQNIVVENVPGASGTIGTGVLARATADGYTMAQGNIATLAIVRSLMSKLPYDVDKDLQMVMQYGNISSLLGVSPALAFRTVRDLIDYAKQNPGKMSYGSAGNGGTMHLSGEMLKLMTGIQIVHVPYKSAQQAITEIIGGQIHFMMDNMPSILPHARAGRVRGIAVSSLKRSPAIPELPTMDESGVKGFEIEAWGGIIVPAGAPKPIVARLNLEFTKVVAAPALKEKFMLMGTELMSGTPEQFTLHVRKETVKWADVIKRGGVTVD